MAQKPTPLIKKAVPAIKKAGLLSKLTGEKDTVLLQMNPREAGPVIGLLQSMGGAAVKNPRTGILSFPPAGGQASHDHDAAGGMGGGSASGGGSRGGTGTTANGGGLASPEGGGGSVSGKGNPSNDHSSGPGSTGTTARGGTQSSPENAGGSVTGPGVGPTAAGDPTSPMGMLSLALHNIFHQTPQQRAIGTAASIALGPVGAVVGPAIGFGMAAGQKSKEVLDGIHNGTITGPGVSISTDANGQEVGHVGGAAYGGTTGPHGGNSGIGGGGGDPAYFNQQQQQNALNASTGIPGQIQAPPANIPSLGLLGQYSQPYQQWTTPGYGFQVPGQGYLQWGQQ